MSTSEPMRRRAARPSSSRVKSTRWPWRSIRNTEPLRAFDASSYSWRSVSQSTTPSPVPGSYDLITPCTEATPQRGPLGSDEATGESLPWANSGQWAAFWILPALRQEVQTLTRFVVPFTMARTRWMLGFQRRFERTWEWLIVTPNDGFLPHTSHTAAMTRYLNRFSGDGSR